MRLSDFYNLTEKEKRRFLDNLLISPLPDDRKRDFLKNIIQNAEQSELRSMARAKYHEFTTRVKHELEKASMNPEKTLLNGTSDEKISTLQRIIKENLSQYKDVVLNCLIKETDPFVIATMISTIGEIGHTGDSDKILNYIYDNDERIRANAIQTLSKLDNPKTHDKILQFVNDTSPRVRSSVIEFLKRRGDHKVIDILKKMVYSNEIDSLKSAVYVLNKMEGKAALSLLEMALDKIGKIENSEKESDNILESIKNHSIAAISKITNLFKK
ncbi:MAG: HEAT repeat domain-containing protein [Candidatus Muirbacterium halophilum]|nr:HEAT repeat domain-containing protein [Candidatus Muirbacterium halophilum]MCK9477078.1 HEAT repeat domain-containing protein [Candidatus Muirbacterium halophilum]